MAISDILHKLIILELFLIVIKLAILLWLFFAEVNWIVLIVVAFGSGILLKVIYTLLRKHVEGKGYK